MPGDSERGDLVPAVWMFITIGPMKKLGGGGEEGEKGGHVLRDPTSRGLYALGGVSDPRRPPETLRKRNVSNYPANMCICVQ